MSGTRSNIANIKMVSAKSLFILMVHTNFFFCFLGKFSMSIPTEETIIIKKKNPNNKNWILSILRSDKNKKNNIVSMIQILNEKLLIFFLYHKSCWSRLYELSCMICICFNTCKIIRTILQILILKINIYSPFLAMHIELIKLSGSIIKSEEVGTDFTTSMFCKNYFCAIFIFCIWIISIAMYEHNYVSILLYST